MGNLPGDLYPARAHQVPGRQMARVGSEGVGGDAAAETGREGKRLQAKVSEPQRCTGGAWGAGGAAGGGGGAILGAG